MIRFTVFNLLALLLVLSATVGPQACKGDDSAGRPPAESGFYLMDYSGTPAPPAPALDNPPALYVPVTPVMGVAP